MSVSLLFQFSRQRTLQLGESWLSIRNLPLTPRPKENEFGSDESIEHDADSSQWARIPMPIRLLPRPGYIRVHCDPGACKGGHKATPDDVPDRSAIVQVGARRRGTMFDGWDREREHSSEQVENGEDHQHRERSPWCSVCLV